MPKFTSKRHFVEHTSQIHHLLLLAYFSDARLYGRLFTVITIPYDLCASFSSTGASTTLKIYKTGKLEICFQFAPQKTCLRGFLSMSETYQMYLELSRIEQSRTDMVKN